MNTFEAIAHIRKNSLSKPEAMRYLIEHLGFSATYADEITAVIFNSEHSTSSNEASASG
jgi:hypothetical protein